MRYQWWIKILLAFQIFILMLGFFTNLGVGKEVSDFLFELERYRLGEVEKKLDQIASEHQRLGLLLVTNLVAVVATLATYLMTRKKHH